jgi:hypothetical protein
MYHAWNEKKGRGVACRDMSGTRWLVGPSVLARRRVLTSLPGSEASAPWRDRLGGGRIGRTPAEYQNGFPEVRWNRSPNLITDYWYHLL